MTADYATLASQLTDLLKLAAPPIAITFTDSAPAGAPRFEGPLPPPTGDGRTGKVPAGCVFWIKATERTFSTTAEDHGNCSVGSLTHGLKTLAEVAGNADVAALVGAGWVSPEVFPLIPVVKTRHQHVVYGPLASTPVEPDVVFLRINGRQAMALHDALGAEVHFEGKPQCHVVAMAKEHNQVAISVGCALSRVRTGMSNAEMTCALPAARLPEILGRLEAGVAADAAVARYAVEDSTRFRAS